MIAADLDLYAVDLSGVIDKYVGETEKNLERIFTEAAVVNAVLLFDEVDAIFGKRSEVRDAHAGMPTSGATTCCSGWSPSTVWRSWQPNLRANLDEALTRRLDLIVDFPIPDATLPRGLGDRCLGRRIPRTADLTSISAPTPSSCLGATSAPRSSRRPTSRHRKTGRSARPIW